MLQSQLDQFGELSKEGEKWKEDKETINRMKRQPSGWEKIFANGVTNKGLISNMYKQLIQLNNKKTTQSKNRWKI